MLVLDWKYFQVLDNTQRSMLQYFENVCFKFPDEYVFDEMLSEIFLHFVLH